MVTKNTRSQKSFSVSVSTVVKVVKLLEEESVLDEFVLASRGLRLDLSPFMSFLAAKGVEVPPEGPAHFGVAAAAARMVHRQYAEEFAADTASEARINVSPRLLLQAKKFIAEKGISRRSEFAASIAGGPKRCPGADPYQCPHT